ncbi:hypothetical protein F8388_000557 [Cannabis sativa]|uniref:Uncharacterized protein n=1 Tax=Cannabis sativa TaxID=3483 RepID=A0A7J6EZV9_CANSA|nr:hypothetical protein F8388_000557 [Cannabis sativa]
MRFTLAKPSFMRSCPTKPSFKIFRASFSLPGLGFVCIFVVVGDGATVFDYSFVARGTVVLTEHTEFTGNFTSIASQCLQKLPASNNKFT